MAAFHGFDALRWYARFGSDDRVGIGSLADEYQRIQVVVVLVYPLRPEISTVVDV